MSKGQLRAFVSGRFADGNPVHEAKHWYRRLRSVEWAESNNCRLLATLVP